MPQPDRWPSGGPLYLSPPGKKATPDEVPPVRKYMRLGYLGQITTPPQGTALEEGVPFGCDTGLFGKGYPGDANWFGWLTRTVDRYGAQHCLWATAPDVPFDSTGTLNRSLPWLERVRSLGIPAAFCAQNGSHKPGMIPWDDIDVLFLGGGPHCGPCGYDGPGVKRTPKSLPRCPYCGKRAREWKVSPIAADLSVEARARGKRIHMGRVNSEQRMRDAAVFGSTLRGAGGGRMTAPRHATASPWLQMAHDEAADWFRRNPGAPLTDFAAWCEAYELWQVLVSGHGWQPGGPVTVRMQEAADAAVVGLDAAREVEVARRAGRRAAEGVAGRVGRLEWARGAA